MTWKEFVAEVEKQIKEQGGDDPEVLYIDVHEPCKKSLDVNISGNSMDVT